MRALSIFLLTFVYLVVNGQNYSDSLSHQEVYEGRIGVSEEDFPVLYWAGSAVSIKFTGTELGVSLDDEKGDNFFQVIIDGYEEFPILIDCEKGAKYYQLVHGLPEGTHIAKLTKRTEPWEGSTIFKGFKVNGEIKPMPVNTDKKLKIEFYGNSITSGMGNEDLSDYGRQNGNPRFKNHYLSYASIASRKLDAEHRSISLSGIGILVSWDAYIMPEIYNRTNPFDETSKWDFTQWTPDIVVINLFQNDSWLVEKPEHEQFKKRFNGIKPDAKTIIKAHLEFVKSIRKEYPNAEIICSLGSMDATREGSAWPGYVEESVKKLQKKGDEKLHMLFFPHNGHPAHPTVFHDFDMADQLVEFIKNEILNNK
ncbi:hypothetical protein [Carboxylicivirga caseinilyticus]|uniref:hypothetical protein n=1 Tax=Carboxylicivirga caseinilyticus TaxID=3417572 RepID=UPI003D3406AC|nr:hypothetical protein [Marinilabiliaceae bacterium A049]